MAADSMVKASTHEKVGHTGQGLWKHKGWQLPAYIQHVANDLKAKVGESRAVEMAVGIVKNWAAGHDGKGNKVSATTQAAAAKAVAEWEALKAKAKGGSSSKRVVEAATRTAPTVTAEDVEAMAVLACDRLAMLERLNLPTSGPGAEFDRLLIEAATGLDTPAQARAALTRDRAALANMKSTRSTASKRGTTTTGTGTYTEAKHPRGFGGKWVASGASGTEVRAVQRRVGARVDGQFGNRTKAAVERFQRQHGLTVDGVVGRQTVAAMRGRRDAKRVNVGALSEADKTFLRGHVRGQGRRARVVEAVAVGSFLDRVKQLEPGEHAMMPDGGAVKHHFTGDGRKVWTAGRPSNWRDEGVSWGEAKRTPEEAVADAFTGSAGSTDPASIGGSTRWSTYTPVNVSGRDATFRGVNEHAQPLVRFDGEPYDAKTATSWGALAPKPRLIEAGAYDEAKHPRGFGGKWRRITDAHALKPGDTLRATGHMSPSSGGRIIKGREYHVTKADRGTFDLKDKTTGHEHKGMSAPEIQHGAGPKNRFEKLHEPSSGSSGSSGGGQSVTRSKGAAGKEDRAQAKTRIANLGVGKEMTVNGKTVQRAGAGQWKVEGRSHMSVEDALTAVMRPGPSSSSSSSGGDAPNAPSYTERRKAEVQASYHRQQAAARRATRGQNDAVAKQHDAEAAKWDQKAKGGTGLEDSVGAELAKGRGSTQADTQRAKINALSSLSAASTRKTSVTAAGLAAEHGKLDAAGWQKVLDELVRDGKAKKLPGGGYGK